jgi:cell division septation protein DedD
LAMIQEKTRGNLSNEEQTALRNTISNLQMAYVEVAEHVGKGEAQSESAAPEPKTESPKSPEPPVTPATSATEGETESKKKFTKSYGS